MVLPLLAAGAMTAAGTGMQMYAADRKKKAVRGALNEYESALGAEDARQSRARQFDQQTYGDWATQDLANTQRGVTAELSAGEGLTQDPAAFLAQVKQTQAANPVQGLSAMSGSQGTWAANTAQTLAPQVQRGLHDTTRQWQATQASDARDAAMTDTAIRRLMAQRGRASYEQRRQLDEAIAQLAWARQQRMLQLKMDQAAGTGAEQGAYGSMVAGMAPAVASYSGLSGTPAPKANTEAYV